MAKKNKYTLQYLYDSYKKKYKALDIEKANQYNDMAMKLHNVDLRQRFFEKEERKELNAGPFGLGKSKKLKYG
tara:strand:- start:5479 stop:5697 length:219 start_codon:yes stop_codon:yes gene_type:complete